MKKVFFRTICIFIPMIGFIIISNNCSAEFDNTVNDDLSIVDISINPKNIAIDQECWITVKAKNAGTSTLWSAAGINTINYTFPDFTLKETITPNVNSSNTLSPGELFYYKYRGSFQVRGVKKLSFTIDYFDQIDEFNESNTLTKDLEIYTPEDQDISITSIVLSKTKPIIDEALSITVSVKNSGKVSLVDDKGLLTEDKATVPLIEKEVFYTFDNFDLTSVKYPNYPSSENPLDPGETLSYVYNGSFTSAGIKNLTFRINTNNRLFELNNLNNTITASNTVYIDTAERDTFVISDIAVGISSSTVAVVNWSTDKEASGKIEYKLTPSTSYTFEINDPKSKIHKATLPNLWAGKNYTYKITAIYGDVTKIYENSFQLPANDNVIISALNASSINDAKKAIITWTTNLQTTGYVYYRLGDAEYRSIGSNAYSANHEIALENLSAGTYSYYVKSVSQPRTVYQSPVTTFKITVPRDDPVTSGKTESPSPASPKSAETSYSKFTVPTAEIVIKNQSLYKNMLGKIVMKVESKGEAYYIHPTKQRMFSLGRPEDAFAVMRAQGIGISNSNLNSIPLAAANLSGVDTDKDGLPDAYEDAVGTNKGKADTDGDSFSDKTEIAGGFNAKGSGKISLNSAFANLSKGKIFLQVENKGEAWYINPVDGKRYFLGRPADAFAVMRTLGVGISNSNFNSL